MKKLNLKRFLVLMVLCVFFLGMTSIAKANQVIEIGIVVCSNLSLRSEPNIRASKIASLSNGDIVPIMGEMGDFYIVNIALLDNVKASADVDKFGYVLKQYVNTNPYYITLVRSTEIWSNAWGIGPAVAEKVKGTKLLVVAENENWYSVQLKSKTAGVGFIKKSELGYTTYNYAYNGTFISAPNAIVIDDNVPVYASLNDLNNVLGYLNKDDILKKVGLTFDGYQSIDYNGTMAYVSLLDIIDIYGVQE